MTTATRKRTRIERLDEGDWLYPLLADAHQQLARQPSPQAVGRIRRRLLARIKAPVRAAA